MRQTSIDTMATDLFRNLDKDVAALLLSIQTKLGELSSSRTGGVCARVPSRGMHDVAHHLTHACRLAKAL